MSAYRIEVQRRKATDSGYDAMPFSAVAYCGKRCVAVKFGSIPGMAFQKAWAVIEQDRQRETVTVELPA